MFSFLDLLRQTMAKAYQSIVRSRTKKEILPEKKGAEERNVDDQEQARLAPPVTTVSFRLESKSVFADIKVQGTDVVSFEFDNIPRSYRLDWRQGEPLRQYSSAKCSERSPYGIGQSSLEQLSFHPIGPEIFDCLSMSDPLSEEQKHFVSEILMTFNESLSPKWKANPDGEYFRLDFYKAYEKEEILSNLKNLLPLFLWRGGDSDSSGPYIRGTGHPDGVDVQIWLDDHPIRCAVSFRLCWESQPERLTRIEQQFQVLWPILSKAISTDPILGR